MQLGDTMVITIEKRQEVMRDVLLVARVQCTDDAEVDRCVFGMLRIVYLYENVAGVHVGMEEVVFEHLREENLHAILRKPLDVCPGRLQRFHIADGNTVDALLHENASATVVPVDFGNVQQV